MDMLAMVALQAAPGAGSRTMTVMLIYVVSFGMIAYFLLIRPQKKLQQKHQAMMSAIKKGDEVMTEGGIIGTVVHLQDDRITIKSAEARLVIARVKIARVLNAPDTVERA